MILISGVPWAGLQQEGEDGQAETHFGGMQHLEQDREQGREHGGLEQTEEGQQDGQFDFMHACCSILRSTEHEMWPGRQPHLSWK